MEQKILGKIDYAEFGTIRDRPFLIGLQLGFKLSDGSNVCDGGRYSVNISPDCKWEELNRGDEVAKIVDFVNKILTDAKVHNVSELINKPVEVTIERNMFKDFRILTEVL